MIINDPDDYVKYRFQKALETLDDAILLAENQRWNSVINRLYYACFYAVIAILLKKNIEVQTHDGARTQFGLQFIKTELVDKKFGKLYSKLFDYRQKGDYGDMFDHNEETVLPMIDSAKEFISEMENFL